MRIPRPAQRRAILLQHRVEHAEARADHQLEEFGFRIDQEVNERQGPDGGRFNSSDRTGYARLLHGGSLLAGLRPRLVTTRVPRAVRSRRSQISTVSGTSPRVRAELFEELPPGEAQRRLEREGAIDEPEVQVEAERRPLKGAQRVHVERDRMKDDLVEKLLPELDRAVPQNRCIWPRHVPPIFHAIGDERMYLVLTLVAEESPYADPNQASGVHAQGTHCDFCHKTSAVALNPQTGAPYPNRSGALSIELMRSTEPGLFFGPYDDVDFGRDTYSPLFAQSDVCASCHSASFWGVPIYQSFNEWQASPYAAEGTTCQHCHMAPDGVTTNIAPRRGGVERDPRTISTHRFPGASDDALLQGAAELDVVVSRDAERLSVEVSVTNASAGHHLPTGSPLRQILLIVSATDEQGRELPLDEGAVLPQWAGDLAGTPGAYFAKILEQLWTGQAPTAAFWTPTRIAEDSRLPARATRTSRYSFAASGTSEVTVEARLLLRRAYDELATQNGWSMSDVLMAREQVSVSGDGVTR